MKICIRAHDLGVKGTQQILQRIRELGIDGVQMVCYKAYDDIPYAIGGMEMLNETLEMNFGIHVDHNIEVDFSGFERIVDLMGGVDINLTSKEAKWMGDGLKAGVNHLNGEKALEYARIRKIDSDFGRTNRQRTVLKALLEKAKRMNLSELNNLANALVPMVTTDMTTLHSLRTDTMTM